MAQPTQPRLSGTTSDPEVLDAAALLFQERKAGLRMPHGGWRKGLWFPSEAERRFCCLEVKGPSLARQSLLKHCRTATHVANLFKVDRTELLRTTRGEG